MKKMFLFVTLFVFTQTSIFFQPAKKSKSQITIHNAWIRPAAAEGNSAIFFEIKNSGNSSDTLLEAKSKLCEIVEIHESFRKENDMMGMREVKKVAVPPNGTVMFRPRGLHVMMINLFKEVKQGGKHEVILVFKRAGKIRVNAAVRDMPAM